MNLIQLIAAHANNPIQRETLEAWAMVAYNTLWLDGSPRRDAAERAVYEQCMNKVRSIEQQAAAISQYDYRREQLAKEAREWRAIASTIEQHTKQAQELMVDAARYVS